MAVFEWEGKIRITIGQISRAGQLDLFRLFADSEWYERKGETTSIEDVRRIMQTDAMVAVIATRKIEVCQNGKWLRVKGNAKVEHDGEFIMLSFPPDYNAINNLPSDLGDMWIAAATEKNGGLNKNLSFFTSVTPTNGKTSNAPKSDEQP
jgi:hypothetical protein